MIRHRSCSRTESLRAAVRGPDGLSSDQHLHLEGCADCRETLWLGRELAALAQSPVARGTEADVLWARAEVVRRLQLGAEHATPTPATVAWGPLVGALGVVILMVSIVLLTPEWVAATGIVIQASALALGSVCVLLMGVGASLALVWSEL